MRQTILDEASWLSRPVPASQRMTREIHRDRLDTVAPGHEISQSVHTYGPMTAVNVDVSGPVDAEDPYFADVDFTLTVETPDGTVVATRHVHGPQILWDRFGQCIEVDPPAPAGEYLVVLRPTSHVIGWYASEERAEPDDDGVSPLPLRGEAFSDGEVVSGRRLIAVDTPPAPNPRFRRQFTLAGPVESAQLSASVLGCGTVSINGRRVGREILEPAVSTYPETVYYRSWDVTELLSAGQNEILVEAGRDRYSARGGDVWGWSVTPWQREPAMIAGLSIRSSDGSVRQLVSDSDWLCADGPVVSELFFVGEEWVQPHRSTEWTPAAVVDAPTRRLVESTQPGVRASAPVPAVTETARGTGRTVYDLGEVMTGRIRCRVSGPAGGSVSVKYGEQLSPEGRVICDNVLAAGDAQVDSLRIAEDLENLFWEPQFGYRGFRWMEVRASEGVTVDLVRAIPLYTPLEEVGTLRTDEPLLEWIDSALGRSFRNNLHGIPTDTPIYEKNGWTADAHLATEALLHKFDLSRPFGKWMDDHVDAQSSDGAIPQIVPTPGWGKAADPAWSASAVLIPWLMFQEYGDIEILRRYRPMVTAFADHLIARCVDGLWMDRTWGDWLSPGYAVGAEGMVPTGTAMTVNCLRHTALILGALDDPAAQHYSAEADRVASAFHDEFFNPAAGHYRVEGVGYRQTLNILPLVFGIVPPAHVETVQDSLADDLEHRTGGHLDCGAIGIRYLLPALSSAGRDDLALGVLLTRTRPGWGTWFEAGERTLLEAWDEDARSRNHYFLGSVASWIQQRVGGLRVTKAGWTAFEIAPVLDDRVMSAEISHRTPRGVAAVSWKRGPGGWSFDVTVPPGSMATLRVPGTEKQIGEGTHSIHVPLARKD